MKQKFFLGLACCLSLLIAVNASAAERKRGKKSMRQSYKVPMEEEGEVKDHAMAGCGLGSMAFTDRGKWSQVGASFVNVTGLQSIAITLGTSNCSEDGLVDASREKEAFVEANYADLSRDLAVGSGEYTDAFASLYGCQGNEKANFTQILKAKQSELIRADQSSMQFLQKVEGITKDSKACQG